MGGQEEKERGGHGECPEIKGRHPTLGACTAASIASD